MDDYKKKQSDSIFFYLKKEGFLKKNQTQKKVLKNVLSIVGSRSNSTCSLVSRHLIIMEFSLH